MLKPLRLKRIRPDRDGRPGAPERCTYVGCIKATRGGKTHCIDHVMHSAYARHVEDEMVRREEEKRKLSSDRDLPEDSNLVRDLKAILWEVREITAPGLTRIMDVNKQQAEALFRAVSKCGLAEIYRNKRGVTAARATFPQEIDPPG